MILPFVKWDVLIPSWDHSTLPIEGNYWILKLTTTKGCVRNLPLAFGLWGLIGLAAFVSSVEEEEDGSGEIAGTSTLNHSVLS